MKNKTGIIINITAIIMCVFVGICFAIFGMIGCGSIGEMVLEICVIIIGTFVTFKVHVILHELGHLLGGFTGGYKLYSFRIGFIKFIRVNDRIKVRFEKLGNNYAGVCQMYPTSSSNIEDRFCKFVKGGIYTSLFLMIFSFIFLLVPLVFDINRYLYLFFAMSFPVSFYLYIINASTKLSTQGITDGMYLKAIKNNLPDGIVIVKLMAIQGLLQSGVRPKDIGDELFFDFPMLAEDNSNRCNVLTNMFSYALDVKDYALAHDVAIDIEDSLRYAPDIYYNQLMIDVFFAECIINKNLNKADDIYNEIIIDLEKEMDLPVLVMKIAYEKIITKNNKEANMLCKGFEIEKNQYLFKGIVFMLEDLVDVIMNETELK